jgi:hypothetical protein
MDKSLAIISSKEVYVIMYVMKAVNKLQLLHY